MTFAGVSLYVLRLNIVHMSSIYRFLQACHGHDCVEYVCHPCGIGSACFRGPFVRSSRSAIHTGNGGDGAAVRTIVGSVS